MMAIRSSLALNASRRDARPLAWSDSLFRIVAILLLVVQIGVIAHRVEHYFVPEQMECGEDSCTAFAPATGASAPLVYVPTLLLVFYVLKFWAVRETAVIKPSDRLGFRAHAPPV
jgi:hypothetical protein